MADDFNFKFKLLDEATANLVRIGQELEATREKMQSLGKGAKKTEDQVFGFLKLTDHFSLALNTNPIMLAVGALTALGDAAMWAGRTMFDAVKWGGEVAYNALAFKESTLASYQIILGSKEAADNLFSKAVQFAIKTPFETQDVVEAFTTLLSTGMNEAQATLAFQGLGDVAAMAGFDKSVIPHIATQLSQIMGAGHLQMMDLRQVVNWTSRAGIGLVQVYDAIGTKIGKSRQEVQAMMHAGQIDSNLGIFGIMKAIENRGTGHLGSIMMAQQDTLKGLMSTLMSVPADTFFTMNLDKSPGFNALKGFLMNIRDLFDQTQDSGKRFAAVVQNAFDSIATELFGGFAGKSGAERLQVIFEKGLIAFNWMVAGIKGGLSFLEGAGSVFFGGLEEFFNGPIDEKKLAQIKVGFREFGIEVATVAYNLASLVKALSDLIGPFAEATKLVGDFFRVFGTERGWKFLAPNALGGKSWADTLALPDPALEARRRNADRMADVAAGKPLFDIPPVPGGIQKPVSLWDSFNGGQIPGFGPSGQPITPPPAAYGQVRPELRGAGAQLLAPTVHIAPGAIQIDAKGADGEAIARQLRQTLASELAQAFTHLSTETGAA